MKKTWQWVIEYKRDLQNDSYAQDMADELVTWRLMNPKDYNARLEIYACYLDWVALTQDQCNQLRYSYVQGGSPGFMKPIHLNDCLAIIVKLVGLETDVIGLFRPADHYRIRNVKTGEIIPGEIF